MRLTIKILIACVLLSAGGLGGFYLGAREGADVMGKLCSQNQVYDALGRLHSSLEALKKGDLAYSMQQHRSDFVMALWEIGADAPAVSGFWTCSKRDDSTMRDARDYLQSHPEISSMPHINMPPQWLLHRALSFCPR